MWSPEAMSPTAASLGAGLSAAEWAWSKGTRLGGAWKGPGTWGVRWVGPGRGVGTIPAAPMPPPPPP